MLCQIPEGFVRVCGHRRLNHDSLLSQIKDGIRHLHGLGLVHTDINPFNIMLDTNGKPIITDFDSCRGVGEQLGLKAGTEGWTDGQAEVAEFQNDYHGLSLIQDFLTRTAQVHSIG